jgi:hypothetical protein
VELPKGWSGRARDLGELRMGDGQAAPGVRARLANLEERVSELARISLDSIPRDTVGLGVGSSSDLDEASASVRIVVRSRRRCQSRFRRRWDGR